MEDQTSIEELEAVKQQLFEAVHGLHNLINNEESSPIYLKLEPSFLENMFTESGLSLVDHHFNKQTSENFDAIFNQNLSAQKERLQITIDLYQEIKKNKKEAIWKGLYNFTEGIFPVNLLDQVVFCFSTGPLKIGPFTKEEISQLSQITNVPPELISKTFEDNPYYSQEDITKIFNLYRDRAQVFGLAMSYKLRTHQLTDQAITAEQARSLSILSGGMSHHFNGLLSVILGYSTFILNRNDFPEECESALKQISEAAQRGRRLTEELLSFTGTEPENETFIHVHDTLRNISSLLETERSGKLRFELKFNATTDTVKALASEVHQMIFSFLTNTIEILSSNTNFEILTENIRLDNDPESQEYLRIQIPDHKNTAPKSDSEKTQNDVNLENPEQEMRLSSLISIVQRIEGTIIVSPEDGEIPQVVIMLPVVQKDEMIQGEKKIRKPVTGCKIWVIDDDELFRDMCVEILREAGHEVSVFTGGLEMQESWLSGTVEPELVLIDFSMPDYNGRELREWLHEKKSSLPVVMVSGLSPNQPDIKRALSIKKTYFLQKPFSFPELSDIVSIAMGENLIRE